MKKKIVLIGLLGISSLLPVVHADNRPGAFTVSPAVAYYHFAPQRHLNNIGMPNLALAYNFNDSWATEFMAGFISTENQNQTTVTGILYMFDGLYRFTPCKYGNPYVTFGVNVMNLKGLSNQDNQYQSGMNGGIGAQWFIDKSIAFRGEIRDVYTFVGGKNDALINVGMSFLF